MKQKCSPDAKQDPAQPNERGGDRDTGMYRRRVVIYVEGKKAKKSVSILKVFRKMDIAIVEVTQREERRETPVKQKERKPKTRGIKEIIL
jgi:hypothetical protein